MVSGFEVSVDVVEGIMVVMGVIFFVKFVGVGE